MKTTSVQWLVAISSLCISAHATIMVVATNETYTDRMAAFGPRLPEKGVFGYLAEPAEDPTGCHMVEAPCSDWVALVRRGSCSFITKVRNMQLSGAIAVAVGDTEPQSGWITMYAPGDTSDIKIPSMFLAQNEYHALLYLSKLVDSPMMVLLQLDQWMTWPLLDVLMILFVSPSIIMVFVYISWRLRQKHRHHLEIAPLDVVSQLETRRFSREKIRHNETEECAICLEDYMEGEILRTLPCRHNFHAFCVDAWLTAHKKLCPICKRDITLGFDATNEVTPLLIA
ncbi:uncharacterized protein BYT42DRAFT_582596 [Radiomyces spectabilis]|uniref:uncharacterized protein n=1 Tax=Radiomyces spectabilis TaxID=64574 RepID=UPI00221EF468|nr:uncharacterized protein BYT42DRAFT_582596 [Radiomyces spectabilis]KAI8370488.1 hypothetical protein BYT42DRAFT_582596 [Radiomyces spectabilis]